MALTSRERAQFQACRSLWKAVIAQAVLDARRGGMPGGRKRDVSTDDECAEAFAWLESSDTAPGSYLWACDVVGVEPHVPRRTAGAAIR